MATASFKSAQHVAVKWKILKDGSISDLKLKRSGPKLNDNQAALNAIRAAAPFEPLSDGAGESCELAYSFDYSGAPNPLGLTVRQALNQLGKDAYKRLSPSFTKQNHHYPPKRMTMICFLRRGIFT